MPESNETSAEDEGISLQVDSLTDHSCSAESDGEKLPCRAGDPLCESGSECKDKYEDIEEEEEEDEEEEEEEEDIEEDDGGGGGERDPPAKPATSSPLAAVEAPLLGHPHSDAARSASKAALGRPRLPRAPDAGQQAQTLSQGILRYNSAAVASNEGLSQTVLNASSVHKQSSDSLKTITNQLEQHYRPSSYDSKKDPTEVCTVGVQPYL
ncbi:unnamed protein product [Bubo scandiacus]